ncbi:MAG: arginyltransferase [Gammaproteobacteria bacterium]|nr:arginyltransferase [Gammaproteobacteria bacterium]
MEIYLSPPHECAYFPDREAITQFIDPKAELTPEIYGKLLNLGFRRSGEIVYRPGCSHCKACKSTRLAVAEFKPRRNQLRCWSQLEEKIKVKIKPPLLLDEHFDLYQRYIRNRHPDGSMDNGSSEDYFKFLNSSWCKTHFIEFRFETELMAVACTDQVPQGLSSLYTFFDPAFEQLSPGVFTILWQIEETVKQGLPWLYLGYWIANCNKMKYKTNFKPIQLLENNMWLDFESISF